LSSFVDFDYSFILFVGWFQLIGALASAAAGAYGAKKSAQVSQQNAREQNQDLKKGGNACGRVKLVLISTGLRLLILENKQFLTKRFIIMVTLTMIKSLAIK
jgi:hypothetical protein